MEVKVTFEVISNCGQSTIELIEAVLKAFDDYPASMYSKCTKIEIDTEIMGGRNRK